jgi:hypothetical protein
MDKLALYRLQLVFGTCLAYPFEASSVAFELFCDAAKPTVSLSRSVAPTIDKVPHLSRNDKPSLIACEALPVPIDGQEPLIIGKLMTDIVGR